jgi:O-antigen ligase
MKLSEQNIFIPEIHNIFNMRWSQIIIVLLVISSLFVKNWELLGINFYLYAVAVLAIYLLLVGAQENSPDDVYQFRIQYEGILLTLFVGVPVLQYLVGIPPRIPDAVLLMVAIVATYHVFSHALWVSKIDLCLVFLATLGTGIVSVALLLLQVYVSMVFDITQHLSTLDIVESTLDARNGYLETVARQGRGIATSVGRFNTPMFLVLFFLLVEIWNRSGRIRALYIPILLLLSVGFLTNSAQSFQLSVAGALLIWGTIQLVRSPWVSNTVKIGAGFLVVPGFLVGMLILDLFAMSYLSNVPPSSIGARLYLWSAALDAFSTRPILGIGIGNFEPLFETLSPVVGNFPWNIEPREPHSLLFGLLAEFGRCLDLVGEWKPVWLARPSILDLSESP